VVSCHKCAGGEELRARTQLIAVAFPAFQERKGIGLPNVSGEEGDWPVK
jgi:hypothetical protein